MSNINNSVVSSINLPIEIKDGENIKQFITVGDYFKQVNKLTEFLMTCRNEPCIINNVEYNQEQMDKKLKVLFDKARFDSNKAKDYGFKINSKDFTLEKFTEECKHFYGVFSGSEKLKSKDSKVGQPANIYKTIFYNDSYNGVMKQEVPFLLASTMFPMFSTKCTTVGKSVFGEVTRVIRSFEEKQKIRIKEFEELKKETEQSQQKDSGKHIEEIADFVSDMLKEKKHFPDFHKSNLNGLKSFFGRNLKVLRTLAESGEVKFKSDADMKEKGIVTGYKYDLINMICSKYSNLWKEREDYDNFYTDKGGSKRHACIMTDRYYITNMIKRFKYMTKEHVNVPLFEKGAKAPCVLYGKNYMGYKLSEVDGEFEFSFVDPTVASEGRATKKFTAKLANNGYLNNLKIVEKSDKDSCYKLSFNTAVKSKDTKTIQTTYTGWIKEPRIRYNLEKDIVYLDLCISGVESDSDTFDKLLSNDQKENKATILKDFANFFKASYAKGRDGSQKGSLGINQFNAMGVDLGLNPLLALAVYEIKKDKKGEDIGGEKVTYTHIASSDALSSDIVKMDKQKNIDMARNADSFASGIKSMIDIARNHVNYLEDIKASGDGKEVNIGFMKMNCENFIKNNTDFSGVEDYMSWIENNLYGVDKKDWKKKTSNWVVPFLIKEAKKKVSKFRSEYHNYEDKYQYSTQTNHVCRLQIEKIKALKSLISMLNSFSTLGLTDDERNEYGKGNRPCGEYWDYINGLRNYLSKGIASIIVNNALRNNVNIIFIEDLDMKASSFDSREENQLKSLWSASQIMDYLNKFAAKHSIVVQKVNPFMTSQYSCETGEMGLRGSGSDKASFRYEIDGEIEEMNSDINAARNIAVRGITRHSNMPQFKAKIVSNNKFILEIPKSTSIQKRGSMMKYLDKDDVSNIVFDKQTDGTLSAKVIKKLEMNKLKKEAAKWKKDNKDVDSEVPILRSGNKFYIRKELEDRVKIALEPETFVENEIEVLAV